MNTNSNSQPSGGMMLTALAMTMFGIIGIVSGANSSSQSGRGCGYGFGAGFLTVGIALCACMFNGPISNCCSKLSMFSQRNDNTARLLTQPAGEELPVAVVAQNPQGDGQETIGAQMA